MRHAVASADLAEIARCLDEATAQAESCHDHRAIVEGALTMPRLPDERLVSIALRTLEAATRERDVWGYRDVARLRATRLADPEGGRAALDEAVARFQTPRDDIVGQASASIGKILFARGYEWVILGQG